MIQRIQSLYLLAITILSFCTFIFPSVDLVNSTKGLMYEIGPAGVTQVLTTTKTVESTTWGLTVASTTTAVLSFIALISYKKRMKQIRLSVMNFVFMVGYYVALAIYVLTVSARLEASWTLHMTVALPLISIILNYLAIGAIGKDEKLVKSLDRIR